MFTRRGFTAVELVVALAITSIVVLGMMPLLIGFFTSYSGQTQELKHVTQTQQALLTITNDLQRAADFLRVPDTLDDKHPAPAWPGWYFQGRPGTDQDVNRTLILRMPATTAAYQNSSRQLVYNGNSADCGTYAGTPVYYTVIYYTLNGSLYRRSVLNPNEPPCAGQRIYQKTSCLGGCAEKDILILRDVSQFRVDYFTNPTAQDPDHSLYHASGHNTDPIRATDARVIIQSKAIINDKEHLVTVNARESLLW